MTEKTPDQIAEDICKNHPETMRNIGNNAVIVFQLLKNAIQDERQQKFKALQQIRTNLSLKRYTDKKHHDAILWMHVVEEINQKIEEK